MTLFRAKLLACAWHFLFTLISAGLTAILVFLVWYPDSLYNVVGGIEIYKLVILLEICLGPVVSFVVFNPNKSKRELVLDYTLIATVQISALVYGLYVIYQGRPVFEVYYDSKVHIVTALELDEQDLKAAREYNSLSVLGPLEVCISRPLDPKKKQELLFSGIAGKDVEFFPEYYRTCDHGEISSGAYPLARLKDIVREKKLPAALLSGTSRFDKWVPLISKNGIWVLALSSEMTDAKIALPINPYSQ